jgi:ribonuclease HI
MRSAPLTIFFDGGARPNPGTIEIAIVTGGRATIRENVGHGGNADAEWRALLLAIEAARACGAQDVILIGDARQVVLQARGDWPCRRPADRAYHAEFVAIAAGITRVRVRHVARTKNLAGIALQARHR